MKHSEYRTAVNNLHRYDNAYFSGSPLISDAEYDRIYFSVQQYEEAHPDRILPDSPTQYAHGEVVNGHRKVARRTIMLSTEKANSSDKVARWMSKTSKLTNDYVYSVEWKYDGLSASLVYINGELTEASYGKGAVGMDFLSTALQIPSIPNSFPLNTDSRVEVRGEVVVPFDKLPKGKYKDCRSAASGILGDTNTTLADRLLFIPYYTDIEFQHGNYPKLSDRLTTLCALGFYTPFHHHVARPFRMSGYARHHHQRLCRDSQDSPLAH